MTTYEIVTAVVGFDLAVLFWTVVISKLISIVAGGGVSLVVKKLSVSKETYDSASAGVEIIGRREGLIAFFLTLIGLSPTTKLVVDGREAVCITSGLLGIAHQSVPLDRVAQVTSGSKVAFEYIICCLITILAGLGMTAAGILNNAFSGSLVALALTAVFAVVSVVLYYINKRFYVGVFPQGGWPMLLVFKPNVIEGVELNLERALEVASIIRRLTVDSRRGFADAPQAVADNSDDDAEQLGSPSAFTSDSFYEDDGDEQASPAELLQDAQNQIRNGQQREAIETLRSLVRQFPGTREAAKASRSLARAGVRE